MCTTSQATPLTRRAPERYLWMPCGWTEMPMPWRSQRSIVEPVFGTIQGLDGAGQSEHEAGHRRDRDRLHVSLQSERAIRVPRAPALIRQGGA